MTPTASPAARAGPSPSTRPPRRRPSSCHRPRSRNRRARESDMPQGDKSAYTDKQKRQARHIEDSYESGGVGHEEADRKSTRLNSSHQIISYAVFCLKKKIE